MTTTREAKIARVKRLVASQATPVLANSLRAISAQIDADPHHEDAAAWRLTHSWVIEGLEARYPEAAAAVERAFDAAADAEEASGEYVDVDYAAVLLAHIPTTH